MLVTPHIQESRIKRLNEKKSVKGDYVLYWMQQSQRAEDNHALEYAVQLANERKQPLLVVFGLMDDYPEANLRHYQFMLEGLQETQQLLAHRGIRMIVQHGSPPDIALSAGQKASVIVCDRGYLSFQKMWRKQVADQAPCFVVQVESDVVIPLEVVSNKAEYAARTIRPKIHKNLDDYLVGLLNSEPDHGPLDFDMDSLDLQDLDSVLSRLKLDRSVPAVPFFHGGTSEAKEIFTNFISTKLGGYNEHRNRPETDYVSHMSKYLHFGQISPLYLAMEIMQATDKSKEDRDVYLEELLVRRELAFNYVNFNADYDKYEALPNWARITLNEHQNDIKPYQYSKEQLVAAETHDPYWNAAMLEMKYTGFMHNYMRMYWGKKIIEWCSPPEKAFQWALELNNRYFLDGRDPNSFVGVGWVFGLHDRAWFSRNIFGKIRYMSSSGLERKADPKAYVEKVNELVARVKS